jgi:hypothetical protein
MEKVPVAAFAALIDKAALFQIGNQLPYLPWHTKMISQCYHHVKGEFSQRFWRLFPVTLSPEDPRHTPFSGRAGTAELHTGKAL